jgi:hypothetical protein
MSEGERAKYFGGFGEVFLGVVQNGEGAIGLTDFSEDRTSELRRRWIGLSLPGSLTVEPGFVVSFDAESGLADASPELSRVGGWFELDLRKSGGGFLIEHLSERSPGRESICSMSREYLKRGGKLDEHVVVGVQGMVLDNLLQFGRAHPITGHEILEVADMDAGEIALGPGKETSAESAFAELNVML